MIAVGEERLRGRQDTLSLIIVRFVLQDLFTLPTRPCLGQITIHGAVLASRRFFNDSLVLVVSFQVMWEELLGFSFVRLLLV